MQNNKKKIGIIDYGMGNVGSIKNMLSKLEIWSEIIDNPSEITDKTAIILPGVGAFDSAVQKLKTLGFWNEIQNFVEKDNKPILGICLGMQLFFEKSEEGNENGFSWFKGKLYKFKPSKNIRVPHLGWKKVTHNLNSKLFSNYDEFYFVHSYHAPVKLDPKLVTAYCKYDILFPAAIQKQNITGFQFHPEKSLKFGMKLLKKWYGNLN